MITKKEILNKSLYSDRIIVEQKTKKDNDFVEMVSLLLHSRTQVHTLHLQTKSYAEHMALNGYYNGIGELLDGLIESYQGRFDIIEGYKSYDIQNYKSSDATIKYFKGLCDKIDKLRGGCKESFIQNQIDTICELLCSTLYKLRFLK